MYIMFSAAENILTDTFVKQKKNEWMDGWGVVSYSVMQFCTRLFSFLSEEVENVLSYNPATYQSICPSSTHTD